MMRVIYISVLTVLLAWFATDTIEAQEFKKDRLTISEFKEVLKHSHKIQIIDVRTTKEYNAGHIKNSIHINVMSRDHFIKRIEDLDKSLPTYLYCHSGKRSLRALKILKKKGFVNVYDLKNGYVAWEKLKDK